MNASVEVATPSEREIQVTRVFDAPARRVFDAHTKPDYVRKWLLGPPGWSMPICEIELKVGGRYHYVWRSDSGDGEFGARGEYREIVAPERLVHTERMEGIGESVEGPEGEALCTLTFVERDGRTTLTTTMLFASKAGRDQALESGMTDGMSASYDRLEAVILEKAA